MNKPNILFITLDTTHYNILESLSDCSNKLTILTKKNSEKKLNLRFEQVGRKLDNVEVVYVKSLFNYLFYIFSSDKDKFDLVISHCPISGFFAYTAKKLKKYNSIFIMCQDFIEYFKIRKINLILKIPTVFFLKLFLKISCRNSEVIVLSNYLKGRAEYYGAKKIEIIPIYGVDTNKFVPKKVESLKKELGLLNSKIIITISRLSPEKGLNYLINAFVNVKKNINNCKLVFVGGGPIREDLEKLAKKLNLDKEVIFLGDIDFRKMVDYYNLGDVVVLPSLKEGLGFASAEAMACEKPVIASNVGGIPDLVINNKTGILIEPANSRILSEKIIYLLNNAQLRNKLEKEGRRYIINNYEQKNVMNNFKNFIISITKKQLK